MMAQKSFITIILLLISTMAFSQKIEVESFDSEELGIGARIESRKDQNDEVCALLKLRTPLLLQGFTFGAGMIAVVATEQKANEIWIYLSPGARWLTINHKNYGSIYNYEFGYPLKAATVYIMKLKDIIIVAPPPERPAPVSQHELGNQYFNRREYDKAKEEYLKSANQGGSESAKSQNRLGYMYEKGLSVPQNWAEAEKWYYKSAQQGYAEAQYNLGLLYEFGGADVKKNKKKAKAWYQKAAAQGLFEARKRLEMI
jgi:hypothetical protein